MTGLRSSWIPSNEVQPDGGFQGNIPTANRMFSAGFHHREPWRWIRMSVEWRGVDVLFGGTVGCRDGCAGRWGTAFGPTAWHNGPSWMGARNKSHGILPSPLIKGSRRCWRSVRRHEWIPKFRFATTSDTKIISSSAPPSSQKPVPPESHCFVNVCEEEVMKRKKKIRW
jgi:hypothetical protein